MSPTGVRRRYYANSDPSGSAIAGIGSLGISRTRPHEKLVVRLRDEGMSFAAVACQIGSTARSVRATYYSVADADVERMAQARLLSGAGLTAYEIAGHLRVHEATVARWTGQPRPGRPPQAALNRRIVQMRDGERLEFSAISRELGLSQQNIRRRYRTEVDRQTSRVSEVRALYQAGRSITEIAQRTGRHEETIHRWIASRPKRGRPSRTDVPDEVIRHMRDDQGLTFRAISESTGLSESTVWRRHKRITVALHPSVASDARPRRAVP
jgi:transposase